MVMAIYQWVVVVAALIASLVAGLWQVPASSGECLPIGSPAREVSGRRQPVGYRRSRAAGQILEVECEYLIANLQKYSNSRSIVSFAQAYRKIFATRTQESNTCGPTHPRIASGGSVPAGSP
jgi:hypothetical protein